MAVPYTDRLRQRIVETPSQPILNEPKIKKTSTERFSSYYKKLRLDEAKYAEYLQEKRHASKEAYKKNKLNDDEEEKKRKKELNRLRVQRCRLKKKENCATVMTQDKITTAKPLTRSEREKKDARRKKDAERKREERAKWSRQKKLAEAMKARDNRQKKKEMEKASKTVASVTSGEDSRTPGARRKALSRAMTSLPKNLAAAENTLQDLYDRLHGQKSNFNQYVHHLMKDRIVVRRIVKRLQLVNKKHRAAALKHLQLCHIRLDRMQKSNSFAASNKLRKSASNKETVVRAFLEEHGRHMPGKKTVGRHGPKLVLEESLETLFQKFCMENPSLKIGRSFFYLNRPRNVDPARSTKYNQCLCEPCENLNLKLEVLAKIAQIPRSKTQILDLILCQREGEFHKLQCISQLCKVCGPKRLREMVDDQVMDQTVKVKEWKLKKVKSGEAHVSKKVLEEEEIRVRELVERVEKDLSSYPMHYFNAKWQGGQFRQMKNGVTKGSVVMVLDFAENYRCEMQDEVQSAHWSYTQCTVHPTVCYYICNTCEEEHPITHSVVAISDDLKHDCFAVESFLDRTYKLLSDNGIEMKRCVQWTDGCGSQYKSKNPFYLLQESGHKEKFEIQRHFFGSRHGKGPADGESAVLKSAASRSVKVRRVVIQNAQQMFEYAEQNLTMENRLADGSCSSFRRSFLLVKSSDINRRSLPVKTALKGTMKIHSIVSKDGTGLAYRSLSCSCEHCHEANTDVRCTNEAYVKAWQYHSFPVPLETASENEDVIMEHDDVSVNPTTDHVPQPKQQAVPPAQTRTDEHAEQQDNTTSHETASENEDVIMEHDDVSVNPTTDHVPQPKQQAVPPAQTTTDEHAEQQDNTTSHETASENEDVIMEHDDVSVNPTTDHVPQPKQQAVPPAQTTTDEHAEQQDNTTSHETTIDENNSLLLLSDSMMEELQDDSMMDCTTSSAQFQEGQYLEVFLYGKNGRQAFRGIVQEVLKGELYVRFMKKAGLGVYVWPDIDDLSVVPVYDVIQALQPPSLTARGRYTFL